MLYGLVVFACAVVAGTGHCVALFSPIEYPTQERCRMAGALRAGMVAGAVSSHAELSYQIACVPKDGALRLDDVLRVGPVPGASAAE